MPDELAVWLGLITTLLDDCKYPAIELAIDELETHQLQQRMLVSQTPGGVVQEVAADEIIEPRRPRVNPRALKRTTFDFPKKKPRDRGPRPDTPAFQKAFFILH